METKLKEHPAKPGEVIIEMHLTEKELDEIGKQVIDRYMHTFLFSNHGLALLGDSFFYNMKRYIKDNWFNLLKDKGVKGRIDAEIDKLIMNRLKITKKRIDKLNVYDEKTKNVTQESEDE